MNQQSISFPEEKTIDRNKAVQFMIENRTGYITQGTHTNFNMCDTPNPTDQASVEVAIKFADTVRFTHGGNTSEAYTLF
ncbi:MAG: hypothetical protein ABW189_02950 [Rickettsiales bacterium]